MKWVGRGAFALLVMLVVAFVALATWEPFFAERTDDQLAVVPPYEAEIVRDEWGVPHIYGKTDADVAFGVAIAHAEDDFFTLQDVVAMSRGRYGAIAGQDGAQFDYVYHLLDARGTAERKYPELPEDTRALFEAYAAGLNQYAAENAEEVKLGNLFPVSGEDVAAGFVLRQPFFYGLGNVIGPLVAGDPLPREFGPDIPGFPRDGSDATEDVADDEQANLLHPLPMGEDAALLGSNAFAVTPEKSGGPTTLISNSHQPLRGAVAWYEFSVESEEGWHFTGANFPGSPFPFLGHNRHLGWTNTVNRPDMADIYKLEMNEAGTQYRLDGAWKDLQRKTVTLPVKLGPITLPIRREVLRSDHGPVIQNDNGYFAIRYGGMDSVKQLDAYYRINKATNLEEWQEQMARLAIPSTNFIYADEEGNIAYIYNAAIPDRPEDLKANWRGVLDGSRSELIWKGAVDYKEIPKIVNPASGWLYNSNNEPFTAAGEGSDLSPADFSPILGVERKQTNRSARAYKLLTKAEVLDRKTLEAIKYDTGYERVNYIDKMFADLEALEESTWPNRKVKEARDLLLDWDMKADNKGPADALAYLMIRDYMSAEYQNKPTYPDAMELLTDSADHLMKHFGRIDPPMSDLVRLRLGGKDLPLDGGSDTLRAATTWQMDDDGRARLVHGDSFIQWVEWVSGERVSSRSIQPFGAASTRPNSPHFTDQMQLFVDHKLKPVYFWRDDVLANAKRRYIVSSAR